MVKTINYQQEVFDEYDDGGQTGYKYKLTSVTDAIGRVTKYSYIKHLAEFCFGGPISGKKINYYADLTDIYYVCSGEGEGFSFKKGVHFLYTEEGSYKKLFGNENGFMDYYKVKERWEEDIQGQVCNKVVLRYQGEAYTALTPEIFQGSGVFGYQTTVERYLSYEGPETKIVEEQYGYHVDRHYLIRQYKHFIPEEFEEMVEYSYDVDSFKCPKEKALFRKQTSAESYSKISTHLYQYDRYRDLIEETNEEGVRITYKYDQTYHRMIRKRIEENYNAENVNNTNLWTWRLNNYGDVIEQRQHRGGSTSDLLSTGRGAIVLHLDS